MVSGKKAKSFRLFQFIAGWTNADCPDEDQLRDLGSRMRTDILV